MPIRSKKIDPFESYKSDCNELAKQLARVNDLLDEDDPHDVMGDMEEAFEEDISAEEFIREAFADDIARQSYDEEQYDESPTEEGGGDENEELDGDDADLED